VNRVGPLHSVDVEQKALWRIEFDGVGGGDYCLIVVTLEALPLRSGGCPVPFLRARKKPSKC